jgi:hypothetical protein
MPISWLACSVLIITITNMVLISIHPFAFKKSFLLVAAILCLSSAICRADSLFMSLHSRSCGRPLNRTQAAPISVSERMPQPRLVFGQSLDGTSAQDFGWILPGTLVLERELDWPADQRGEMQGPLLSLARAR